MPKEPTTPTKSAAEDSCGNASETPGRRRSLHQSRWTSRKRGAEAEIGLQLKKTDALEKYHLQPKDLEGLYYIPDFFDVPGKSFQGARKMYRERDVELQAREHHTGVKPFKVPTSYIIRKRADPKATIAKVPKTLLASKEALERKTQGHSWLWACLQRCYPHLGNGVEDWMLPSAAKRAKYFQSAIRDLPNYPPRTVPPAQLTHALQALRNVLDEAPVKGEDGEPIENEEHARKDELESGAVFWFWSKEYFTRVYQALYNVVLMDGVGPFGWGAARWMVYDEYSKWSGIEIDEEECKTYDNAHGWLQGRLPNRTDLQLEFSAFEEQNVPPLIWSLVNARLPVSNQ
ncbi:hypothetical protein FA13DRAFT_1710879 [Coprinellus micaceus]|uniref:Uncharacterized protein n=1 Tax=Coprinellus micaceus TaxID=71717 RepID=A0A4Y7T673_COPMI|nr:hypothetical protein FA13DRAFT_1710879 [Coprinellus micaceus]